MLAPFAWLSLMTFRAVAHDTCAARAIRRWQAAEHSVSEQRHSDLHHIGIDFLMNNTTLGLCMSMSDAIGRPLWSDTPAADGRVVHGVQI